eukprot:130768-Chlamydomonas_euryale.AAC.1
MKTFQGTRKDTPLRRLLSAAAGGATLTTARPISPHSLHTRPTHVHVWSTSAAPVPPAVRCAAAQRSFHACSTLVPHLLGACTGVEHLGAPVPWPPAKHRAFPKTGDA